MKPIPFTSIRLVVFVSLAVLLLGAVMLSKTVEVCIGQLLGLSEKNEILKFLGIGFGGILLVWQAVIANKRAKAMEETAKAQAKATEEQAKANENTERGQRQERLKNAIEHLGEDSDSVRLGGAYELFHLAQDTPDLRQTVLDILCAHIRQTTGDNEYRGKCKSKPSEEIQSLLTLLFVQKYKVFKGCHINLQGSWLNGARLERARLRGATLDEIYLQGAFLTEAHLQGASLIQAQLGGAFLPSAYLQGTILLNTHLEQAKLAKAGLQGAFFHETYLQSANLHGAQMQGVTASEGLIIRELLNEWMSMGFTERIRTLIHQESDVSGAFFFRRLDPGRCRRHQEKFTPSASREIPERTETTHWRASKSPVAEQQRCCYGLLQGKRSRTMDCRIRRCHVYGPES